MNNAWMNLNAEKWQACIEDLEDVDLVAKSKATKLRRPLPCAPTRKKS